MSNSLLDFAEYQHSRGKEVTPELLQVGRAIEEQKQYRRAYEKRPLRCRLGLHKRERCYNPICIGHPATCVICWRHKL